MIPQISDVCYSSPDNVHKIQTKQLHISGDLWLSDKKQVDGAEGLWRVHNDLYDLTNYIRFHPGGSIWLELTKGTDVTEAFESHHITLSPVNILKKFQVRTALTPRNSPFTFKENDFYQTLKMNIREELPKLPTDLKYRSKLLADLLLVSYMLSAIIAARCSSYFIGTVSGVFLAMLTVAAHNFFHQKDSFRMYYFDMSLMSSREIRISHVLSHHCYTNTIRDMQIQLPDTSIRLQSGKPIFNKSFFWIYNRILFALLFISDYLKRIIKYLQSDTRYTDKSNLFPFIVPVLMYFFGEQPITNTFILWFYIVCVGSLHFSVVTINAVHHNSNIFYDEDTIRSGKIDWGIAQLNSAIDHNEQNSSHFISLVNFGDHRLHHLFPALDHSILPYLFPVLEKTYKDFNTLTRDTL